MKAIASVKEIQYEETPMGTIIESESLSSILKAVEAAHEAVFRTGIGKGRLILRIDYRRNKPRAMEDKVTAVKMR